MVELFDRMQSDRWVSTLRPNHFDVLPSDDLGARKSLHRLEDRFLGSQSGGEMASWELCLAHVLPFVAGERAAKDPLSPAIQHAVGSSDIHQIDPDSDHGHDNPQYHSTTG